MSKRRFPLPFILIGLGLALGVLFLWPAPDPLGELPYRFTPQTTLLTPQQKDLARKATLLVVGDRRGERYGAHLEGLRAKILPLFRQMKMVNLSTQGHGLHRTLKKLEELDRLPLLVLFMGAHDEFMEKKFDLRQRPALLKSFLSSPKAAKSVGIRMLEKLGTLIPPLAKLLPPSPRWGYDKKIVPKERHPKPGDQQKELALRFKTYELEIQRLIDLVKSQNSRLILTTAPIPLETPPQNPCANASTPALEKELNLAEKQLESGQSKRALLKLESLERTTLAHARLFTLLGKAYLARGKFASAQKNFTKAHGFDCDPRGPSPVLNNIIRLKAQENHVPLVDVDQMVGLHLGRKKLFDRTGNLKEEFDGFVNDRLAKVINDLVTKTKSGSSP
ncbi:MAG: hypothetical protein OXB88_10695 [Bacteriovoracales bacterium]|nr:hypothetical protein [Bacteriovoracales bacterium]